jgi:hypothetical protein
LRGGRQPALSNVRARTGGSVRVLAGLATLCLELRTQPLGLEASTHRARGPARRGTVSTGAGRRIQSFGETSCRCLAIAQLGSLGADYDPKRIAERASHAVRDLARGHQGGEVDDKLDAAISGVHALAAGPSAPRKAPGHRGGRNHDAAGCDHVAVHATSVQGPSSCDSEETGMDHHSAHLGWAP